MVGRLTKTKAYLIGHMQYKNGESWREYVLSELKKMGIVAWSPYDKPMEINYEENDNIRMYLAECMKSEQYSLVQEVMKNIRNQDLRLCDLADFCIAHLYPEIASWGSAEELTVACKQKKPVFISIEGGKKKCPLWLLGMFPHKYIYNSVEDIISMIKCINDGSVEIDSDRWKLLKPQYR